MQVINSGTVVASGRNGTMPSCAFAGIAVLPSGRWLCGFRTARTKASVGEQTSMLTWSDDEGRTWSKPVEPFHPPVLDGRPGRFRAAMITALGGNNVLATLYWVDASHPELPFFNEETQGLLDSKIMFSISRDNGESWSREWLMDTTPYNQPTPITGPVLVLPSGEWICQFELNKHYYETGVWRHSSVFMFSRDQGRTWPEHAVAAHDPDNRVFYWDQRPGVLADGRVLDLFWTYDNEKALYLNIHGRVSEDSGRTWSALWDTGVPGQPAPPIWRPDGTICMVYVDRTSAPVIKARVSADGGRTWPAATEILVSRPPAVTQTESKKTMQDAWAEMEKFSIGLPATSRTAEGDVLVTYYSGPETDVTDIKWARLR